MKFTGFLTAIAVMSASLFALVDTNSYRIAFRAPLDTTFFSGDTLKPSISLYGQDESLLVGEVPVITVRLTGAGGTTLVNAQNMTDNRDGTYSYPGIYLSAQTANANIEVRVRVNIKGTRIEDRVIVYHGATQSTATTVSRISFLGVKPVISGDSNTIVSVRVTNLTGAVSAGQNITMSVVDSNGVVVQAAGTMVDIGRGIYYDTIIGSALRNGEDYVVRVQTQSMAPVQTQICLEAVATVIPAPVLVSPVNGTSTLNACQPLVWNKVANADTYFVQIDTLARFTAPFVNAAVTDTQYTPSADLPKRMVFWRISSNLRRTLYSGVGYFTVLDGNIPAIIPVQPDPTPVLRPRLLWYKVTGATSYNVQIDTAGTFLNALYSVPTSDTFYLSLVDLPMTRVFWRVRSNLSATYSAVDTFTIVADTIPMLVRYDGDTLNTRRPSFSWHPVNRAEAYTIQLSHSRNFNSTPISTQTADTFYNPLLNLDTASKYFWRVSCNLNNSVYSTVDSFIIIVRTTAGENGAGLMSAPKLLVSPNPFSGLLNVSLSAPGQNGTVKFELFDVAGRLMSSSVEKLNAVGTASSRLTGRLSAGTYLLRAAFNGKVLEEKLISVK
ncbi:MAG: T9SS type A sorting domain-containing protein [Fibrobacteres bacterium]|nr:T9SS type A sorting domain-containing protein [Fibrobacterota bacterium]